MPIGILTTLPALLTAATRDEEEFVTELRNLPEGWLAAGGLALVGLMCWAVVWMYRHEGRIGATLRLRTVLAVIRCAVILGLVAILLDPVRVRILRRWIDSYTILLVDDSSSMDLTDRFREPESAKRVKTALGVEEAPPLRRAEVARRMLEGDQRRFLRELVQRNRVALYTFSGEPTALATMRAQREGPKRRTPGTRNGTAGVAGVDLAFGATGATTNIERAVRRTVESVGTAPLAGVVVLSDGGFNQGADADEVARYARERRVPIYAIGIGDPSPPRNVRVTELLAPQNAFRQDPFAVTAQLASQGMEGQTIEIQLRELSATGGDEGRVVDTRTIAVGTDSTIKPVTFQRRQDRAGRYLYAVEVPVMEFETVADDNSKQATVTVIDARTRVLLISGTPSWEYRYLTRLLERDETFDVSCWLQSADLSAVRDGDTVIDHMPRLAEELFPYDVIVLLDADRSEFDEPWCRLIDTFVTAHSGGLLVTAARAHTPDFLRDETLSPLHDLLPVTLDPEADLVLNRVGHYQLSPSPIEIPTTAFGHPILRLADDATSTKLLWQDAADVYWHYPVMREKPVATVLLRHGNPRMRNANGGHVLAAVQYVGSGRSGFVGFDGTWRWRRHGPERFDRFWVQMLRYLAEGKLLSGAQRGSIITQSDQFALGEAVNVSARLFDARFEPIRRDEVTARYRVDGGGGEFTLKAQRDQPGWFEGRFVPETTGSYAISVTIQDPGDREPMEVTREIRVSRPNIEVLHPQLDRAKLRALAEGSHGGRYFEVDEMQAVPDLIPDLHEEIPIRSRPRSLWDNGVVLAALLGLLTIEWALRKWNRLL